MKQLNLYYLGGGVNPNIPDGKTVLPVGDIQTWIKCAGRSEDYTALSEVLVDTVCLNALMQDNNAVDYLIRSRFWISDITSNQNAMTYIGAYNYAADSMIDDDYWLDAIGKSAYIDSVLNIKVPTMTSNTTPSGVVSRDSVYTSSAEAYKAVDNSATAGEFDAWISGSSSGGHRWQYQFTKTVRIVYMYISGRKYTGDSNGQIDSFVLQGSNDGSTYTNLTDTITRTVGRGVRTYHIIHNENTYQYYRVANIPNTIAGIGELQFYGREDV